MKMVTHLIMGLGKGGGETALFQLLKYKKNSDINYKVISYGANHFYEEKIRSLGIELVEYNFKRNPFKTLMRTIKELKKTDTLCCWMYKSNFIGYFLGKKAKVKKIIWCIRHSDISRKNNKKSISFINYLCAKLSKRIDLIAYNGEQSRINHENYGYCSKKSVVVDNGCDCEEYSKNSEAMANIKSQLNIPPNNRIILSISRDSPIKDLPVFIKTTSLLKQQYEDITSIMCGQGIDKNNSVLLSLINNSGLKLDHDIFLLGLRNDIVDLLSSCEIYVLHSLSEAFPNSLLQAMATSCLCVSTNVGDAKRILNDNRFISKIHDPVDISSKVSFLLDMSDKEKELIRIKNRKRSMDFDIHNIVDQYEDLWK